MTHPIRVGIQITQQHATYPQIRDAWKRVDESGADTLFNWDHFFPLEGDLDGPHLDNWTALGAMAEVTKNVQFGCLVAAVGYHNPHMLADRARSLDHFSNGRFVLGLGSGWNQRDYEEYDFEFGTAASRLKDLERDLKIIVDRMDKLNPPPIQNPLPIMIGGGGEKVTLRLTAEYANIWNGQAEPDVIKHKNQVLDEWCAKVGRDPNEIERSVQIFGPQLDKLDEYYDAGVTHFLTASKGPDYDLSGLEKLLAWRDARQG